MKYLLIDANNLAIRSAFANSELKNQEGLPTSVHYGFFNSLLNLKQQFPGNQILIVWDGKSQRRMKESKEAVSKGLIKSAYKENRKKDEQPQPLLDFYAQAPHLKNAIEQTGIPQIRLSHYEADDVIASYCKALKGSNEITVVTSDEDYIQVLDANVTLYDGMKQKTITKDIWMKENNITPEQFVHMGALMGDTSDNIFGVYGIGEKGALKLIQEHGRWEKVMESFHAQVDPFRNLYPDLKDGEFPKLQAVVTKSGEPKYPDITINTPFTGVALAIEEKKIKEKVPKTTLMALMFEERVGLAYSLKKMDDNIPDLPPIVQGEFNEQRMREYFEYYDIRTLMDIIDLLK